MSRRLSYCIEVLCVDARVAYGLTLDTRSITDHVGQQHHLVIGHALRTHRRRHAPRNGDPVADLQGAQRCPTIELEDQRASRCHHLTAGGEPQVEYLHFFDLASR